MTRLAAPGLVYLLCFEKELHGRRHYVGYTTADRLHERMLEHLNGAGSNFTHAAYHAGIPFVLARTWTPATWTTERALIPLAEHPALCVHCLFGLTQADYRREKKRPAPKREGWAPVGFAEACRNKRALTRESEGTNPMVGTGPSASPTGG